MEQLKPLKNNIIVKQDDLEEKTPSGIIINITRDRNDKPSSGVVEAVGDKVENLRAGDHVVFGRYAGVFMKNLEDEERLLLSETEILGVTTKEEKQKIKVGDDKWYKDPNLGKKPSN